jgi:hypothetical protein
MRRKVLRHNEIMKVASAMVSGFASNRHEPFGPHTRSRPGRALALVLLTLTAAAAPAAHADGSVYYQCPGNVFTNTITAKEAEAKGCKSKEAQQPTTIPAPRARPLVSANGPASHVDAQEQKARDSDSRKILLDELAKAQAQLDALKKQYNNGVPERQGDEKNYQKYLDRTADLKASIARTEADVAAINRELAKTP